MERATRRGNYESGSDYVLEYGELRFSFNEADFSQRVEQAAVKLDFTNPGLAPEELHDLTGSSDVSTERYLAGLEHFFAAHTLRVPGWEPPWRKF